MGIPKQEIDVVTDYLPEEKIEIALKEHLLSIFDLYSVKTVFVKFKNRPKRFTGFCRCHGTYTKGRVYYNIFLYERSERIHKKTIAKKH